MEKNLMPSTIFKLPNIDDNVMKEVEPTIFKVPDIDIDDNVMKEVEPTIFNWSSKVSDTEDNKMKVVDEKVETNKDGNSITRIYSYHNADKVLTLNNIGENKAFVNCLERVHSFIDCCHDQFDPSRMSSFFKSNTNDTSLLRDLIWKFSFGDTGTNEVFLTNGETYTKKNHIHKLADALNRNISNQYGFTIQLPGQQEEPCKYNLPEMIERPWKDDDNYTEPPSFATYKFHNYNPSNSAAAGGKLRKIIGSVNSAYILDCGKRLFHENFTTDPLTPNNKGKAISIFSGVIDSSTVNDPVLKITCTDTVIEKQARDKLQFLIPFINVPGNETVYMYCTFQDYEVAIDSGNNELFLAFLGESEIQRHNVKTSAPETNKQILIKNLKSRCIEKVTGKQIPDLTNVTNYLAGPARGCFRSLANTLMGAGKNKNPCYLYEQISEELCGNLGITTDSGIQDFKKAFQICFKHIGDKTRLMDAVMVNSLADLYNGCGIPFCHTGTIDTFSNRYASLGNLYTVTAIKKSNLFVNDNKTISKEQMESIIAARNAHLEKAFSEQSVLFKMVWLNGTKINVAEKIIDLIIPYFNEYFRPDSELLVKREKHISRLNCSTTDYWDIKKGGKFTANAYTTPDIQLIESMELILRDIKESYAQVKAAQQEIKTFYEGTSGDITTYSLSLQTCLDMLRLSNLFDDNGITINGDQFKTTKNIMFIATGIAKSGFSPRKNPVVGPQKGGNLSEELYEELYNRQTIYNNDFGQLDTDIGAPFVNPVYYELWKNTLRDNFNVNFFENDQVIDFGIDNVWLGLLQKNFVAENLKHKLYGGDEDEIDLAVSEFKNIIPIFKFENIEGIYNIDIEIINTYQDSLDRYLKIDPSKTTIATTSSSGKKSKHFKRNRKEEYEEEYGEESPKKSRLGLGLGELGFGGKRKTRKKRKKGSRKKISMKKRRISRKK